MAISDMRREYQKGTLDQADLADDPIKQFQTWFAAASTKKGGRLRRFGIEIYKAFHDLFTGSSIEPNVMALATTDSTGQPSVRFVLLKDAGPRGFTFYTNYQSRKGQELTQNPNAALVFHWPDLERQVCVAGSVTQLSREESAAYFQTRPRKSQIGALASDQSTIAVDRAQIEARFREIEAQYAGQEIPIPPHWGGYLLTPDRIEFWQGRRSRLHDRFRYLRTEQNTWKIDRLFP